MRKFFRTIISYKKKSKVKMVQQLLMKKIAKSKLTLIYPDKRKENKSQYSRVPKRSMNFGKLRLQHV